jgi:hypothetical protein
MDKRGLLSFNLKNVVLVKWIKEVSFHLILKNIVLAKWIKEVSFHLIEKKNHI